MMAAIRPCGAFRACTRVMSAARPASCCVGSADGNAVTARSAALGARSLRLISPVGALLFFACAKKSKQKKHTPGLRALAALGFPAMLAGPAVAETRGAAHRSNSQRRTAPDRLRFSALRKGDPKANSKASLPRSSAVAVAVAVAFAFAVRVPLGRTEQRSARREWPARTAGQVAAAARMPRRRRSRAREQRRALRVAKCGPRGVLSFAYFSLHKQRKVRRAPARNKRLDRATTLMCRPAVIEPQCGVAA